MAHDKLLGSADGGGGQPAPKRKLIRDDGDRKKNVDQLPPPKRVAKTAAVVLSTANPATASATSVVGVGGGGKGKGVAVPKTALDKAITAIRALGKPSSPQAIFKYVASTFGYDNSAAVKRALKAGVGKGLLTKIKASYWVSADKLPVAASGPTVVTEVLRQGPAALLAARGDDVGATSTAAADSAAAPAVMVIPGARVTIDYELRLAAVPDRVVERGKALSFCAGDGDVIKGMEQGILGMQLGERRRIHVPWSLGYGKRGSKPDIPSEADLVFVVTLRQCSSHC